MARKVPTWILLRYRSLDRLVIGAVDKPRPRPLKKPEAPRGK